MKKFLAILIVAATVSTAAFALPDLRLSAGALGSIGYHKGLESGAKGGLGYGFAAFFDATYASLNVGMDLSSQNSTTVSYLTFGLLGKYPIALGEKLFLAPALGFDYSLYLAPTPKPSSANNMKLDLGAVIDYSFSDALYLRGEVLAGYGLPKSGEKGSIGADFKIGVGYRF